METLSSSSKTVSNAIGQFQTGGAELKDGTSELSDGMTEFSDTINDKLDGLSEITDPNSTLARVIDIMKDRADSFKGSGRADGLGMEDRTKCAIAFCEEVKAQGYKPGVYASTLWYRKRIDLNSLKKYTIWNAHYGVASSPIDCDMWQGTEKARINGYSGELDANISYMG